MKRKINVIASFDELKFELHAFENKNNEDFMIFEEIHRSNDGIEVFFKNAIEKLENKIQGKVKKINILFQNAKHANLKVSTISHKTFVNLKHLIRKEDILKNIREVKKSHKYNQKHYVLRPIKYMVTNGTDQKTYLTPPLNKEGQELEIVYSISTVNEQMSNFAINIFNDLNIEIKEIFTNEHTISFLEVRNQSKASDALILNINQKYSSISFTKQGNLVSNKIINLGSEKLLKKISQTFFPSLEIKKVNELINIYGKIVIDSQSEIQNPIIKNIEFNLVNQMIGSFFRTIIKEIKVFVKENNIKFFDSILIYGNLYKINNLKQMFEKEFTNTLISTSDNKQHLNTITKNQYIIGANNFLNHNLDLLENKYETLVETRPFTSLFFFKKRRLANIFNNKFFIRKEKHV